MIQTQVRNRESTPMVQVLMQPLMEVLLILTTEDLESIASIKI
jgi:hypothetical protein